MKTPISILSILLLLSVCHISCENENIDPLADYNWTRIDVPEASTIYSLTGNIDDELLVGGLGEISKTVDQGTTWSIVLNNVTAYGFRNNLDTLFANGTTDFYSLDRGDTWQQYANNFSRDMRSDTVITSDGTLYKVVDPGVYPKQPDQVLKSSDGGSTWVDIFPYKRYIYSIYLDDEDRLYIGVNGWEWDESTNSFDVKSGDNKGVIYYLAE